MSARRDPMKAVMVVSGLLTATMIQAAFDPQGALHATFGEDLQGPLAEVVVRNWGILIALMGGLLVYGAFRPAARPPILVAAGLSKMAFIGLVLSQGTLYLGHGAGIAVAIDTAMVVLFAVYLAWPALPAIRGSAAPPRTTSSPTAFP